HYRACSNKETLHGKSHRPLVLRKIVPHESAERFHGNINGSIHDPQGSRSHPESWRIGHDEQSNGRKNGAYQEIRSASSEAGPGAVAEISHNWLYHQAGDRGGDPENGNIGH